MFSEFFKIIRICGLRVSIPEWMTLMEGISLNLHRSSLTGFYYLARAILVKTESEYDKFDTAFAYYFRGVVPVEEVPSELDEWLAQAVAQNPYDKAAVDEKFGGKTLEEILKEFEERMAEQDEMHNGGDHWIGTGGTSMFGHSGYNPNGVRIGGESRNRSAVQIASARNFRDFRDDSILDLRQFQMAFRRLRQFSSKDEGPKDILDLEETIQKTSDHAGNLSMVFRRPRRNMVKVLLLFDSGGSMDDFSRLCAQLFQAAQKSNHFKDLKAYFFHNCFYDNLFTDPSCTRENAISTEWVMNNLSQDYKVIVVGDAYMSPYELMVPNGCIDYYFYNEEPGIDWIRKVKNRYKHMIWLNPIPPQYWEGMNTMNTVSQVVPMFPLSVQGLEQGLKHLMSNKA